MIFKLNDEQELLLETIRAFSENEIATIADKIDDEERFPEELLPMLGEIGVMGIPVSEEYGGIGMGTLENTLAVEEISKSCASTGVTISAHSSLCCCPIEEFGTEEQKQKDYFDITEFYNEIETGKLKNMPSFENVKGNIFLRGEKDTNYRSK